MKKNLGMKWLTTLPLWCSVYLLGACQSQTMQHQDAESHRLGGAASVAIANRNSFSLPSANMPMGRRLDFSVGNSFFRNPWVSAPATTTARDGLGPLFNTNACQNCHINDGRGHPPGEPGLDSDLAMIVRISLANGQPHADNIVTIKGAIPVPHYGLQIQPRNLPHVPAEAQIRVSYQTQAQLLRGGETIELRQPHLDFHQPAYGPLPDNMAWSARIAPPMIGLGLLQSIPDQALRDWQVETAERSTSGRLNRVWDIRQQKSVIGRFGWKAGQPNLNQQIAAAFHQDMGITSELLPEPPCEAVQTECLASANGGTPELSEYVRRQVEFYSANLAVPQQRGPEQPEIQQGRILFERIGCADCHKPHWRTGDSAWPWLAHQDIYPYTDLMLHDMGEGLADHRDEFDANGREWRTPPLWGIGLTAAVVGKAFFLHDGRARSLSEAIIWHGGQALASQQAFSELSVQQRHALLSFLHSL